MKKIFLAIIACAIIMIAPCNTFAASIESYHSNQTTASTMSRQPYTKKEKKAISVTKGFLKKFRQYNFNGTTKYQKGKLGYTYWEKNSQFYSISKKMFTKKFSYKIIKVTSSGNNVKIKAKVTYPDAYFQAYKAMDDSYVYTLKHPKQSSNYIVYHYTFPRIIQRIKKYGVEKESSLITFTVKNTKKGQKIIKMSGGKKIALMGISDAIEDWANQW